MNVLNIKSTMNSIPQYQNPNSLIPNCETNLSYPANYDQLMNDPLYFDITNYLMSDEDNGSKEHTSFESKGVEDRSSRGSFDSVRCAHHIKPTRGLNKYKALDECSRFAFRTKTQLETMDDGYKWRKYGKKMVKNNPNPRNYYKCSSGGCNVKKRVERDCLDASYVITTYQGTHNHASPTCILYC